MFIYLDNKQVKKEFKKIVMDENITMSEVAKKLDILPQQLNNRFGNARLALSDLSEWLNVIGYDLVVEFKKRD